MEVADIEMELIIRSSNGYSPNRCTGGACQVKRFQDDVLNRQRCGRRKSQSVHIRKRAVFAHDRNLVTQQDRWHRGHTNPNRQRVLLGLPWHGRVRPHRHNGGGLTRLWQQGDAACQRRAQHGDGNQKAETFGRFHFFHFTVALAGRLTISSGFWLTCWPRASNVMDVLRTS